MSTLAENAAAVKAAQVAIDAAIAAKGGTTAGGLTNAAEAIAAIPSDTKYANMIEGWFNNTIVEFDTTGLNISNGTRIALANGNLFRNSSTIKRVIVPQISIIGSQFVQNCAALEVLSCNLFHSYDFSTNTSLTKIIVRMPSSRVVTDYASSLTNLRHECVIECGDGKFVRWIDGSWTVSDTEED